ncbi:lysophospholipid acyltransferase family protein [Gilvimarinus sp. DA14]|uniref:lysophospholipid acyltransferase family protein n=1 Tax=Gilvimarinus sp. DA14 TaxID=2956798 RepID=UPI0020B84231|nr:lysophospholipid acyltransferase family protein [Gilvimarinus sp. DA14]UTF59721.1 1-acyl-sn-glycerol-3-phosphate acyltransferase [Gilvimarinus sp. DA14]
MLTRFKFWGDRLWRTLATGLCFASFSVLALAQSLLVFPVIYALPGTRLNKAAKVRAIQQRSFFCFVRFMEWLGLIRVSLHNTELLQRAGGCLVVANHPTLIDVVILFSRLPKANCVVKGELWRNAYIRGVMLAGGFISNASGKELLQGCQQALDSGQAVLIFPEGSRSVPGQPLAFKRGAANVAVRTQAPIVTAFITCEPLTLVKGAPWYQIPPRRADINVYFHEIITPSQVIDDFDDKPKAARLLTRYLEDYYTEGLKRYG